MDIERKFKLSLFFGIVSWQLLAQSLGINEALRIALKNNYDIQLSENDLLRAKANNTLGNAGMLPTVSVDGGVSLGLSDVRFKPHNGDEIHFEGQKTLNINAGAQLNWKLFDGGKMFVTKKKLSEIQLLGETQFKLKVQETQYDVYNAYFSVVSREQELKVIQNVLAISAERLKLAEAGLLAGTHSKADLLQAEIDHNTNLQSEISLNYTIDTALKQFNVLIGLPGSDLFKLTDSIFVDYVPDEGELFQKLDTLNIGIQSLHQQIKIAEMALKEVRTTYFPFLNLKAGYYASRSENSDGQTLRNLSMGPQLGATISIPVYSAGEIRRKVSLAKLELNSAQLNLEQQKKRIKIDLRNTLLEFETQKKLLEIENKNNSLAYENLLLSVERLRQGQTSSLEVHQAQQYFVQSTGKLVDLKFNLKMAEIRIKQIVSEL